MRLLGQMLSMGIAMMIFAIVIGPVEITPPYYSQFSLSLHYAFILFTVFCIIGVFTSLERGKRSQTVHSSIPEKSKSNTLILRNSLVKVITMKILCINASPRGNESNTLQLVKSVIKGSESEGAEAELIDLYDLRVEYCTGCGACYATGECPQLDDFEELFDRILNSDGIVLGAPN